MSRLSKVIVFTAAAFALPAAAQTAAPATSQIDIAQLTTKPAKPPGKGGAAPTSQPTSSNLTAQECRDLGGKTETDKDNSCKYGMRCTITLANGNVNSICIDEIK